MAAIQSPYRLPLPKSASGGDLVNGIIDKFNSLSVTDREEQKDKYERQISKLKAALDRAQMAREEAESEARKLREKLLDVQDERQKEKTVLRERAQEYEKKYEKAKDRFKLQRAKNEDAMRKVQKDVMENEKRHWRAVAVAQEEMEWERRLRSDAHELVEFLEVEKKVEVEYAFRSASKTASSKQVTPESTEDGQDTPMEMFQQETEEILVDMEDAIVSVRTQETVIRSPVKEITEPVYQRDDQSYYASAYEQRESPEPDADQENVDPEEYMQNSRQSLRQPSQQPSRQPSQQPSTISETPKKQTLTIPVRFGDDKENTTPQEGQDTSVLKMPLTIDRAAALAAIQYRRGRAKSFVNGQVTPKKLLLVDPRRDVSAPPLVTMSVGRRHG